MIELGEPEDGADGVSGRKAAARRGCELNGPCSPPASVAIQQSFPDNDNIYRASGREVGRDRGELVDHRLRRLRHRKLTARVRGESLGSPHEYAAPRGAYTQAPPVLDAPVEALRLPRGEREPDLVAVEEPLEIRIGGEPVAVTMRTPGHDEELALGFCVTEGLEPVSARAPDDLAANTVEVEARGFDPERLRRHFYTSSSCGVCGKGAIEAIEVSAPRVESTLEVRFDVIASLPTRLREAQRAFAATGGLHATGLFDADGELVCVREDVGRHNAMDKVVGWAFLEGELPLAVTRAVRQRPALVRARAEGGRRGVPDPRRGRRAVVARGRARGGSRRDACAAGCATGASPSTPSRGGSSSRDGRAARRRRLGAVRLAEGARAVPR